MTTSQIAEAKAAWAKAYYEAVAAQNDTLAFTAFQRYYRVAK